jgi:hypothetical protein
MRTANAITLLLLMTTWAAAAEPPATTQAAAEEVEVAVTRIEPGATMVSATLTDLAPANLFFKLAQVADVGIVPSDDGIWDDPASQSATFSAEWDKQPLWHAVAEACEAVGVRPRIESPNSGRPHIRLERGALKTPFAVDGPVMIRPVRIARSASVSYANGARQDDRVRLSFDILLEPKLRKNAWIGPAKIDEARDENGKPLPAQPPDDPRGQIYGQPAIASLSYPRGAGKQIALIRGEIPLTVVKEMATITFHDPFSRPREMTAKVGPHRLVLKPITGDAKSGWHVDLHLQRGSEERNAETDTRWSATANPLGSFGAYIAMIGLKTETLMSGGSGGTSDTEASTQIHFSPREAGDEPTALRVEVPVSLESRSAKFEFKDLTLP